MKKSIATVSLPGKLREKLEAIAAAGFDGVEIFEPNLKGAVVLVGRCLVGSRRERDTT